MLKRGRNGKGLSHLYSFNGKEDDNEWWKQDYGERIYSKTVCRFLSVDPIGRKYPFYSPYQFAGNMPIIAIDLDGLEPTFPKQPYEAIIIPAKAEEIKGKYYFEVTTHTGATTKMEYYKGAKGTFSNAQAWRMNELAEINHVVRNTKGFKYGSEYSGEVCAYDCLTLVIGQAELLFGKRLPRASEMKPWLDEMAKQGYAGEERTVSFSDASGKEIKSGESTIAPDKGPNSGYFGKTISEILVEMAGERKGLHVFGVALGDGHHSLTITLDNSAPDFNTFKPVFQVYEQTNWTDPKHNGLGKIGGADLNSEVTSYLRVNSYPGGGVKTETGAKGNYQTQIREYINQD